MIKKSTRKDKKYMTNDKIHFGQSSYNHFKDQTPLKLYSHKNHNDINRLINYYKRHYHDNPLSGKMTTSNWKSIRSRLIKNTPKDTALYYSSKYLW